MDAQGRKTRQVDVLYLLGQAFPSGSTRRSIYDLILDQEKTTGLATKEPYAVIKLIVAECNKQVFETMDQRQQRVENEYDQLMQGKMTIAQFNVKFRKALNEREKAGCEPKTDRALTRDFVQKMDNNVRWVIFQQEWRLDGNDAPGLHTLRPCRKSLRRCRDVPSFPAPCRWFFCQPPPLPGHRYWDNHGGTWNEPTGRIQSSISLFYVIFEN